MAEQTLNNPLSGSEVIEAVLSKLREKMQRDCYLNPNSAYDWFMAKVSIELDMHDTGAQVKSDHVVEIARGAEPKDGDAEHVEASMEIDAAPPNEVRVDTNQPVPTLSQDASGRKVVKGVKYSRSSLRKAS